MSDVLAAVLDARAGLDGAAASTLLDASVDLLRRCLERDPKQRLHDIADARLAARGRDRRPAE